MTIHDGAKELFDDLGLDRDDVAVVAKSIGQRIIDESEPSDQPLCGMVYDVRTLYDEGVPECSFEVPDEEAIRFRAQFHVDGSDEQVERQRVFGREKLRTLVEELPALNGAGPSL